MAVIEKDLGPVSAYAVAVAHGYTGTEAEWEALIANSAINAQSAGASATAAAASAQEATQQKTQAQAQAAAAQAHALDASRYAQNAGQANSYAQMASSNAAVSAANASNAQTAAEAAQAAAEAAVTGAEAAQTAAEAAVTDAQTAKTAAETAAATAAAAYGTDLLADDYSTSKTYAVGDYVIYSGNLYRCTTAITTAEAWTAAHWTRAQVGPELDDLKSAIGNWEYSVTNYNDWHNIEVHGVYNQGDLIFVQTYPVDNCTIFLSWFFGDDTGSTFVAGDATGKSYYITAPSNVAKLRVSYKTSSVVSGTYTAIVVNTSINDNIAGKLMGLNKTVTDNQSQALSKYTTIDSPFSSAVDAKFAGIIAFNFIGNAGVGDVGYDVNDYDDFKVTNIYYKDAFYMYMPVQGYKNGAWTGYDAIEISLANAPTESAITILTSKYGRFKVAIIPSLMTAGRATGVDYRIKHSAVDPFFVALRKQADQTVLDLGIGDFELQDHIAHIVTVKQDGSGDYTTIAAAYAAITDSSFLNQYEIVVYPGTYEEVNLICPNFSHTHGLAPNTVTVTSVGKTGTQPVFEQRNGNSKLSNMTIISGTGYCVHQDSSLNGFVLVNENLHCIKDYGTDVSNYGWESKTNPSVVGDGAQYYGAKFIWRNCTFENGEVACHSNSSSNDHANQHFILENCRLVNARIWLGMAGSEGASPNSHCVAEIKGLYTPPGCQSLKYKLGARVDENEPNFIWQIIGGENENFAVVCDNSLDTQTTDTWGNINTNEKALVQISGAVTKGQWLKYDLSVCGTDEAPQNVLGVALENGSSGDTIQVWIGNAFAYTATNGEYGIGANGSLSTSATVKIGRVYKNIFYRY